MIKYIKLLLYNPINIPYKKIIEKIEKKYNTLLLCLSYVKTITNNINGEVYINIKLSPRQKKQNNKN